MSVLLSADWSFKGINHPGFGLKDLPRNLGGQMFFFFFFVVASRDNLFQSPKPRQLSELYIKIRNRNPSSCAKKATNALEE